jgi:uncharacterized protein (DUF433 family)
MNPILDRITTSPDVCGGKPSIRQMRFTVAQMLELLASGMTHAEILADYPFLEKEDIEQVLQYAARLANGKIVQIKAAPNSA